MRNLRRQAKWPLLMLAPLLFLIVPLVGPKYLQAQREPRLTNVQAKFFRDPATKKAMCQLEARIEVSRWERLRPSWWDANGYSSGDVISSPMPFNRLPADQRHIGISLASQ